MLFRFSLYGFLKNQRYFEPFLILAFLDKGLSYFQIGILIGFRELCVNLFEVPSGVVADLYGRRRSMVLSFTAYIASFLVFAFSGSFALLFVAMMLYAGGDAFRTGTHKAMIFDWLRMEGRGDESTRFYGFTRSWSKIGSAVSVVIAAALVFYTGRYTDIFLLSIIPYALNIVNFFGYPRALDGDQSVTFSWRRIFAELWRAVKQTFGHSSLRRLVEEAVGFDAGYAVSKEYLQPVIKQAALALPVFAALSDDKRAALLVGAVYFVLHLLSSVASRQAHRLPDRRGHERAARALWWVSAVLFLALVPFLWREWFAYAIAVFVLLEMLQNVWRPLIVARINDASPPEQGATVLSIESQAKSLATVVLAPLVGFVVDRSGEFWPVAVLGLGVSVGFLAAARRPVQPLHSTQNGRDK